jgi:DNA-binding response OmpR family regulator
MTFRLLVVEDDRTLRSGLRTAFAGEGYEVVLAADGHEARALLRQQRFDLVVLDIMLPGPSGLELLRELRRRDTQTPVLLLTARGEEGDKVFGFDLGADDYVGKPFSLRELLARTRALLRRVERPQAAGARQFALGETLVDLDTFQVVRGGASHVLSPKEAAMLGLLRQAAGKAVSRERFLAEVWGGDQFVGDRTIDTHMLNLRQKVEPDPKQPRYLLTVHGIGYRLETGPEGLTDS